MIEQMSLRDTLNQLADEGFPITDEAEKVIAEMEIDKRVGGSPWYVRLFVGLSAWIAAILLIGFLFIANILTDDQVALIFGAVFCLIAVGLNRFGPRNDFLGQLGLALSLAGQILFTLGLSSIFDYEFVPTALGLIGFEIVLLWLYQSQLHRAISTLVIFGAILSILLEEDIMEAVHALIFVLGAGFAAIHYKDEHLRLTGIEDLIRPVSYSMAIFLLGLMVLPLLDDFDLQWWITAVLSLIILIFLILQVVKSLGLGLRSGAVPWLLVGSVVLLVPAIRMPGILGALIVLVAGFWRSDRPMIGIASAFLVFYLGAYYYSLEWTLLVKSFALMGTGAILFLLRFILLKFARGGAQ